MCTQEEINKIPVIEHKNHSHVLWIANEKTPEKGPIYVYVADMLSHATIKPTQARISCMRSVTQSCPAFFRPHDL